MSVQNNDPTAHAEIECIRNTGRIGTFKGTILYSTLTPCYLCAGAAVQFGINRVIVGESRNFEGAREFMTSKVLKLSMWIPQNAWKSCVDLLQSIQICGMKISVECELLYCVCQFFGCPVRVSDV